MSNGIKYFMVFALGAAAGSVAAWGVLKTRYEESKNEEVEEVREYYRKKYSDTLDRMSKLNDAAKAAISNSNIDKEVNEFRATINNLDYNNENEKEGGSGTLTFMPTEEVPYVISPSEFADNEDEYQTESLTLYSCGTLTDDFDNPIEDVDAMVGDALNHFGEYEDDCVYVKNDRYKCYYEILKDVRTYEEVINRVQNLTEYDE